LNQSLSARNIVKHYGGVVALADGNLDVRSREVVALIGANGSGKSTLSKVINGVVVLDGGQLLLGDKSVEFSSPQAAYEDFNNLPTDITDKKSDSNLFQGEIGEVIEVEGGYEVLQIESGVVRDIILGPGEWQDYSAEFDFMVLQPPQDYQDSELNIFLRTNKDNWIYPMEMYEVNLSNTFSEFKIAYRKSRSEE